MKRRKDGDYIGDFRVLQEIILQSGALLRALLRMCFPKCANQILFYAATFLKWSRKVFNIF